MPYPIQGRVPGDHAQPVEGYDKIDEVQHELDKLRDMMAQEVETYAKARATGAFASDRRKEALSDAFVAIQGQDPEASASSLEHRARASKGYKDRMSGLYRDEVVAESIIANWKVMEMRLDVLRGYLSIENAKLKLL